MPSGNFFFKANSLPVLCFLLQMTTYKTSSQMFPFTFEVNY